MNTIYLQNFEILQSCTKLLPSIRLTIRITQSSQGPISLKIFPIIIQIRWKFHYALFQIIVTVSLKFCTCHNSCVVVAVQNFRDIIPYNGVTLKSIFYRVWIAIGKLFVKWDHQTHSTEECSPVIKSQLIWTSPDSSIPGCQNVFYDFIFFFIKASFQSKTNFPMYLNFKRVIVSEMGFLVSMTQRMTSYRLNMKICQWSSRYCPSCSFQGPLLLT